MEVHTKLQQCREKDTWTPDSRAIPGVQVIAWPQTGHKAFHEPMMTQFTDAYMHH